MQAHADPIGFCAIIDDALFEPWVLQCILGSDALLGVVDKY